MATVVQYPVQEEGDSLTAGIINALCAGLPNLLVNFNALNLDRYALDSQHLPEQSFSNIFSNGYEATASNVIPTLEATWYCNSLPMTTGTLANEVFPYTYQSFDADTGGSAQQYVGGTQDANSHLYQGWRIPALNQSLSNIAKVTLNAATNFDTANISGVLCRAGVEINYMEGELVTVSGGAGDFLFTHYPGIKSVAIAIGWEDGTGNKHVVERSVRFNTGPAVTRGNISTATYLTQDDLDEGDGTCAYIFIALATVRTTDVEVARENAPSGDTRGGVVDIVAIHHYNLSTTPIRAGSL